MGMPLEEFLITMAAIIGARARIAGLGEGQPLLAEVRERLDFAEPLLAQRGQ
jgi:hypothetical protein